MAMKFAKSPSDFTINFEIPLEGNKKISLNLGNIRGYDYQESKELLPVHCIGGGQDPIGVFEGRESVQGVVIINEFAVGFETELQMLLTNNSLKGSLNIQKLKNMFLVNAGKTTSEILSPEDITIDALPEITIKLFSEDNDYIETIEKVKFFGNQGTMSLSQVVPGRQIQFQASKVNKLKKIK